MEYSVVGAANEICSLRPFLCNLECLRREVKGIEVLSTWIHCDGQDIQRGHAKLSLLLLLSRLARSSNEEKVITDSVVRAAQGRFMKGKVIADGDPELITATIRKR